MLKFAVSACRVFRRNSALPPTAYSPKCLEECSRKAAPHRPNIREHPRP
jgi:hypothetical protein